MPDKPLVSAVVVVGECRNRSQKALDALTSQTLIGRMEVVVVDLAGEGYHDLTFPEGSPVVYIRKSPAVHWQDGRILGFQASRADIVAFSEEHAYPEPGWAEAILEAHRAGDWPIVGYAILNANPGSYWSRCGLMADYGRFTLPMRSGVKDSTSGNNIAFKRGFLIDMMREFGTYPFPDFILQERCAQKGIPMYVSAEAVTKHENFEGMRAFLMANFYYCHIMAGNRARFGGWSSGRRLLYCLATPWVATPLKTWRLADALKGRTGLFREFILTLPVTIITYIVSSLGESLGYVHQIADAEKTFTRWEMNTPRKR
jgi:hypothetical protein